MNKNFKNSITMILTLLMLISSIPSFAATPTFEDVPKSHWSNEYVEDMAGLGYLTGYDNGTFKPEESLTFMEAMSTLSRFLEPIKKEKEKALTQYEALLKELNIKTDWDKTDHP